MNIIITGASRGIGYDTALQLAREGHQVIALSRNEAKLKALQSAAGENLRYLPYDLTQPNESDLRELLNGWTSVDVLINNSGLLINKPFMELTEEDWQSSYGVNIFGVVQLVKLLMPKLEESNRAHILNIGSMGGFQGSSKFPGLSAYSSSKAALANLTECLAEELKDKNIYANCLALGAVQTEMLATAFPGYQAPVECADMASFMVYFSTKGHHFFNGKVLPVAVSTP